MPLAGLGAATLCFALLASACARPEQVESLGGSEQALTAHPLTIADTVRGPRRGYPSHLALAHGAGTYAALWDDGISVWFGRMSGDGQPLGESDTEVAAESGLAHDLKLLFDGSNYRAIWQEKPGVLRVQTLSPDGELLGDAQALMEKPDYFAFDAAFDASGRLLVAYCAKNNEVEVVRFAGTQAVNDAPLELGLGCELGKVAVQRTQAGFVVLANQRMAGAGIDLSDVLVTDDDRVGEATKLALPSTSYGPSWTSASNGNVVLVAVGDYYYDPVSVRRLDSAGKPMDSAEQVVTTALARPTLASSGASFMLFAEGTQDEALVRFDGEGKVLDTEPRVLGSAREWAARAVLGDGEGYLAMLESYALRGSALAVRIDEDGAAGTPFSMPLAASEQAAPATVWTGHDFLTVWADNRDGWDHITLRATHTSLAGVSEAPSRVLLDVGAKGAAEVALATNGKSSLLAWESESPDWWSDQTSYVFIDEHGAVGAPHAVSDAHFSAMPAIATDGKDYLLLWREFESLRGLFVDAAGEARGQPFAIDSRLASAHYGLSLRPAAVWTGSHYLVAWGNYGEGTGNDVRFVAAIEPSGEVSTPVQLDADLGDGIAFACKADVCLMATESTRDIRYYAFAASGAPSTPLWSGIWPGHDSLQLMPSGAGFVVIARVALQDGGPFELLRLSPTGATSEAGAVSPKAFFSHSSLAWDGKDHALFTYAYPAWYMPTREKQLGAVLLSELAQPPEPRDAGAADTQDAQVQGDGGTAEASEDAGSLADAGVSPDAHDGGAETGPRADDAGATWPGANQLGPSPIAESFPLPQPTHSADDTPSSHSHGGCSVHHQGGLRAHTLPSLLTALSLLAYACRGRRPRRAPGARHSRAT